MTKQQFKQYIQSFDFTGLFNQLGWSYIKESTPIKAGEETFTLNSVAEKSGFRILVCQPDKNGGLPEHTKRLKIDNQVSRLFKEHLIIFINKANTQQVWQTVKREMNKPAKLSSANWHKGQEPELLYQKASGLIFTLEEEDVITIVDVTNRIAENFYQNNERVTKQFYDRFKKEHTSFLSFIKGIDSAVNKDWYASLMLNRLMFCYFIQKKGFLDQNKNYLRDKLKLCRQKKGKDKFYSFYRSFLLVLFHEGLNERRQKEKVKIEIGRIPYLNGGLFDEHELEKSYAIDIDDKAFELIFDFFDQYEWHLDTRITATGKDVNPDVIGYIFEKYINDRAQMGAYYTKEDITDYISKNCIIPWLFDETARNYPKAFDSKSEIWTAFQASGDEYIYDAVKHGIKEQLPKEIEAGIKAMVKRTDWNRPATAKMGLPTEIWRETVERRKRCEELKRKIEAGEHNTIHDFITHNLNIRKFAQDIIERTNDPAFLETFYKALNGVTIIDPTCGSGAFLFAAMNILEPLYHTCIMRMRGFTEDEDRQNEQKKQSFSNKYKYFREVLENIQSDQHPNLEYFIYKSIILNNLYGVDIMKEAVEIAKLRLFLKLVATVEADYKSKLNFGLEPLPDIDFNIRAGNTLVGFSGKAEVRKKGTAWSLFPDKEYKEIEEAADKVSMAYEKFQDEQLMSNFGSEAHKKEKAKLLDTLSVLNKKLNKFLVLNYLKQGYKEKEYQDWLASYQPFHWFAQFFKILDNGGFDIIIGNPPYVEYGTKLKAIYTVKDYDTLECGNLHAFVAERCFKLISEKGYIGLIIPLPSISTSRMVSLQNLVKPKAGKPGRNVWISAFDERPSSLFDGVDQRLIIEILSGVNPKPALHTTGINRWTSVTREYLFPGLKYTTQSPGNLNYTSSILKIKNDEIETGILKKVYTNKPISFLKSETPTKNMIYYRTAGGRYWKVISDKPSGTGTVSEKAAYFHDLTTYQGVALISSSCFWWYYSCHFDMFNLKDYMIFGFRFSEPSKETLAKLNTLGKEYLKSLEENAEIQVINSKTKGSIEQKQYFVNKSKYIIDQIDAVLGAHYGFTESELEFVLNYDIKNRLGKELGVGEEE